MDGESFGGKLKSERLTETWRGCFFDCLAEVDKLLERYQDLVGALGRLFGEVIPDLFKKSDREGLLMTQSQSVNLLAIALALCLPLTAQSQSNRDDSSLTRAKELWELAIAAKGGRERLHQVRNVAVSDRERTGVDFAVFPNFYFSWVDTNPSKFGLLVEMFNFELDNGYIIFGSALSGDSKMTNLNPDLRSRFRLLQLHYFLETKWFKPEIVRSSKGTVSGKRTDLIDVLVKGWGKTFLWGVHLDEKTHLPIRIGVYRDNPKAGMFTWVDLKDYQEVAGIQAPTAISAENGRWGSLIVEINVDYDPKFFERMPDMNAGPYQWRMSGPKPSPLPDSKGSSNKLTPEQIAQYIKDLESSDGEKVMIAGRELSSVGDQAEPALTDALKSKSRDLRYFAAVTLLRINEENEAAVRTLRDLLLDPQEKPQDRQSAAFRLAECEKGISVLTDLLRHPDPLVRRCVIFAFDELTELTEIPAGVKPAIPILKELLKDNDEVVRRMAEEVLEQIERRPRKR